MCLVGWCVDPDGLPGNIALWLRGQAAAARVERFPRKDVADALALAPDEPFGFRLELPAAVWATAAAQDDRAAGSAWIEVREGHTAAPMPDAWLVPSMLAAWADQLRASPEEPQTWPQFPRLVNHLARFDRAVLLDAGLNAWVEREAEMLGYSRGLHETDWQPAEQPTAQGQVDRFDGLSITGWVYSEQEGSEPLRLFCNEQPVDCSIVRIEREDVRQALQVERTQLGFELEVPVAIWALAQGPQTGVCTLELRVWGRPLRSPAMRVTRDDLLARIKPAREQALKVASDESPLTRAERQYTLLLLLEHLVAARALPLISGEDAAFVNAQIDRYKLHKLLPPDVTSHAPAAHDAAGLGVDFSTRAVWRLQREFNDRLLPDGSNAQALVPEMLQRSDVVGEVRQRWLLGMVPFFCSREAYASLRPYLDAGRLRGNSRSQWAADLSIVLPELIVSGDLEGAGQTMALIQAGAPGWLNTECVGEAVRLWCAHCDQHPLLWSTGKDFMLGFIEWLWAASADYWSRLHDHHIATAAARLAAHFDVMPADLVWELEWRLLRSCALVPGFWTALALRKPQRSHWTAALRDAHDDYRSLRSLLPVDRPAGLREFWAACPTLLRLHAHANREADIVLRELVLAVAPQLAEADPMVLRSLYSTLDAVGAAEPLRLAAHPLATLPVVQQAPALPDRILRISGVPMPPLQPLVERTLTTLGAWQARAGEHSAAEADACFAATREWTELLAPFAQKAIGVYFEAVQWLLLKSSADDAARLGALALLREHWSGALETAPPAATPPAALVSAWSLLGEALAGTPGEAPASPPDADLEGVVAEMTGRLRKRWPESVLQAAAPLDRPLMLRATNPLASTLVVVYSCRRNLETRIQRIRETWIADLQARGIPYVVMVGNGRGELVGDVLSLDVSDAYEHLPAKTLAMVEWVYHHTNFQYLLKIDDDCHLAVDAWATKSVHVAHHYHGRLLHRGIGDTDRLWHREKSSSALGASALDKSPEPSLYADGGAGYSLSRYAMGEVSRALATSGGKFLTRSAYMEDKLLGDLLALRQVPLSNEGHQTLLRRRFGVGTLPVNAWQGIFYPGPNSPTLISHLDNAEALPKVQAGLDDPRLTPGRLWPTHRSPVLSGVIDSNQLELLSAPDRVTALEGAEVIVVGVAHDEMVMLPHFLAHYRALGVRHFVMVDNLSTDGSREYLLEQPDVLLYSADTEYRYSHYGVSWQQAVLAAHAQGRWAVLADMDEFLVYPGCETRSIQAWLAEVAASGNDALLTLMVDMYPEGPLSSADFEHHLPFEVATGFDRTPLLHWRLGSGQFSNAETWLSSLRHRLIADAAPNHFTSQKVAVFRYNPWVRLSEGLHYAANLTVASQPVHFAHFKYHAGFHAKVMREISRKQHFNGAEEYRKYLAMLAESTQLLFDDSRSDTFKNSSSFAAMSGAASPSIAS